MFNVKIKNFLSKLNKKHQEIKYLKKLLPRINEEYDKEVIEYFLNCSTYEELKNFLKKQNLINYDITPEDFEKDFYDLKDKIAFELNEAILKKYNS